MDPWIIIIVTFVLVIILGAANTWASSQGGVIENIVKIASIAIVIVFLISRYIILTGESINI